MNENLRSFNTKTLTLPLRVGPQLCPRVKNFPGPSLTLSFPQILTPSHTNTQERARANDGADNRGQGTSWRAKRHPELWRGRSRHVLQCHQAGHLFPWKQAQAALQESLLPSGLTQMPRLPLTCVPGPPSQTSSGLQEVGNSGLANFYSNVLSGLGKKRVVETLPACPKPCCPSPRLRLPARPPPTHLPMLPL